MRHSLTSAVLATLLAASCAVPSNAAPSSLAAEADAGALGFDVQRLRKLDDYMEQAVTSGRFAGATILLARHGRIAAFHAYGKRSLATGAAMPKDEIFRIYTMTKPVTAAALMILFEEGKWRLDDPVERFLPELAQLKVVKGVDEQGALQLENLERPPTMRELLSHTAGFAYGLEGAHPLEKLYREQQIFAATGLQQMVERIAKLPLMYEPGTGWSYSVASDIQGRIIEKLSGRSLGEFLEERIFEPLKMADTAFHVPADKAQRLAQVYVAHPKTGQLVEIEKLFGDKVQNYLRPPALESGGGGLVSTTLDYARFAQMLANKGELDGARILSPATVELIGTNVVPPAVLATEPSVGNTRFSPFVGFGLGVMVVDEPRKAGALEGKGTLSWAGAAGSWFWVDPENDVIFVGMLQRMGGTGGDDLRAVSRALVYQALTDPRK